MADDIKFTVGVDYTELTGLIKTTDQTKRALSAVARQFAKTGDQKQYMRGINQIVSAQKKLENSSRLSRSEIMKLGNQMRQEEKFTESLAAATYGLRNAQMAATKSTNRMGVVTQQAGYQVSDFIVQVQSGTNPFVAFSQQASQLAGVLPLMADKLKISAVRLIGISSVLGIVIPLVGALGAAFLNKSKKVEAANKELEELISSFKEWSELSSDLSNQEELNESFSKFRKEAEAALAALEGISKLDYSDKLKSFLGMEIKPKGGFQFGVVDQLSDEEIAKLITGTGGADVEGSAAITTMLKDLGLMKSPDQLPLIGEFLRSLSSFQQSGSLDIESQVKRAEELLSVLQKVEKTSENREQVNSAISKVSELLVELTKKASDEEGKVEKKQESRYQGLIRLQDGHYAILRKMDDDHQNHINSNYMLAAKTRLESDADERDRLSGIQKTRETAYKSEIDAINNVIKHNRILLDHHDNEDHQFEKRQELRRKELNDYISRNKIQGEQAAELRRQLKFLQEQERKLKDISDEEKDRVERARKLKELLDNISFPTYGGDVSVADVLDPRKETGLTQTEALRRRLQQGRTNVNILGLNEDPVSKKRDPLADLKKQLDLEQALIGKTEARQRVIRSLGVDFMKYGSENIANIEAQINKTIQLEEAERKRQEAIDAAIQQQEELKATIEDSMSDAFMSIIDGTKSVEDAFRDMARQIIAELMRVLVVKQMVSAATSFFGFADGGVISNGNVVPYANGGVVGGPTYFPMAGGKTGLMGEAGPEAIMPLKRGKNGKLGVTVDGNQQQSVVINQSFNFSANGDDSVKRIIAAEAPKIAKMTEAQILENRRRGGQFRKAFA